MPDSSQRAGLVQSLIGNLMRIPFAIAVVSSCTIVFVANSPASSADGQNSPEGQLSEASQKAMATVVRRSLGISEEVKRVRDGKIVKERVRIIAAILRNTREVEIHQMRGATENKVYLHPQGKREAVYGADGKLVTGFNAGSYNYFHPYEDPLRHFTFDIAPWLLLGRSPDDPTTGKERVHAYAADIFAGLARARRAKFEQGELSEVQTDQLGSAVAIAVFLAAVERGEAEEIFEVFEQEEVSAKELIPLVKKIEAGLLALIRDAQLKGTQGDDPDS